MRSAINRNLKISGQNYINDRTGESIRAIINNSARTPRLELLRDNDIKCGDWLTNEAGSRIMITHVDVILDYYGCQYVAEYEYSKPVKDMQSLYRIIEDSASSDKDELRQIVSLLEDLSESKRDIPQGCLSRFSQAMEHNSWISSAISSALLNLLLTP